MRPQAWGAHTSGRRRHAALQWLRRIHGWMGLWGAVLGLLFGVTGILLNHRAVMKIPGTRIEARDLRLAAPVPPPASAAAMAAWVRDELRIGGRAARVREEPARPVPCGARGLVQPARFSAVIATPRLNYQLEYWVGSNAVSVRALDADLFTTLNNLHKGVGVGATWVLLADTIGGAMLLLSLTGVLLWTRLRRRRLIGVAIATIPAALALGVVMAAS